MPWFRGLYLEDYASILDTFFLSMHAWSQAVPVLLGVAFHAPGY